MKKVAVSILILLYFSTSIGATIRMHFCMGELVSWTLNTIVKDDKCSKCDMKCEKGCCEEKSQVVKIDKDQKVAIATFEFSKSTFQVEPTIYQNWQASMISFTVVDFPKANAPPDKGKVPLFVRNGAFLI
jgi:hypothetical protein